MTICPVSGIWCDVYDTLSAIKKAGVKADNYKVIDDSYNTIFYVNALTP